MTRNKRKIIYIMLAITMCISMLQGISLHAAEKKISMKKELTLEVGDTKVLTVSGTKETIKWSTSNKKVAVITKVGRNKLKILGKDNGTTVITAKANNQTITCKVKIVKKQIRILLKSTGYSSSIHNKVT